MTASGGERTFIKFYEKLYQDTLALRTEYLPSYFT